MLVQKEELQTEGMTFPLKGATDELIILRRYHSLLTKGATAELS